MACLSDSFPLLVPGACVAAVSQTQLYSPFSLSNTRVVPPTGPCVCFGSSSSLIVNTDCYLLLPPRLDNIQCLVTSSGRHPWTPSLGSDRPLLYPLAPAWSMALHAQSPAR